MPFFGYFKTINFYLKMRLISALVLLIIAASAMKHKCTHDKHQKELPPLPPVPEGRSLESIREDDWESFRMHIEYGNLDVSAADEDMIKEKILYGTKKWY